MSMQQVSVTSKAKSDSKVISLGQKSNWLPSRRSCVHVSSMPHIVNNEIRYSSAHRRYLPIYCEWIRATFFLVDFQLLSIVAALRRADCANSQSIGNPAMFCTWLFVYLSAQVIGKHYAAGLMDGWLWMGETTLCTLCMPSKWQSQSLPPVWSRVLCRCVLDPSALPCS